MIRILVVDDSAVLRKSLRFILESDSDLQVVGEASNGMDAIAQVQKLKPDVVTMDLLMPKLGGLGAIQEIMTECPVPIVVVTSADPARDLELTKQATRLGAVSLLQRPETITSGEHRLFAEKLIAQVRLMNGVKVVRRLKGVTGAQTVTASALPAQETPLTARQIKIVAIGSSTGGPAALHKILSALPPDFAPPILIVQHISFGFVEGLAGWLDAASPLKVQVGKTGQTIEPGHAYVAPDGFHMIVDRYGKIMLDSSPPVASFRPSVTPLFKSIAKVYGENALGVILTGMGADGAAGMKTMFDADALTIAQDQASCVVFGMPKEAIALGAARRVLPLDQIAGTMAALCVKGEKA